MLGLPKTGSFFKKFFFKEGRKSVELVSGPFCLNRALCVTPSTQRGSVQAELPERLLVQDPPSLLRLGQICTSGAGKGAAGPAAGRAGVIDSFGMEAG